MHTQLIDRYGEFDGIDLLEPLINRRFKDKVALVSSFGAESAVLLHMVAQVNRDVGRSYIALYGAQSLKAILRTEKRFLTYC